MRTCIIAILGALVAGLVAGLWIGGRPQEAPGREVPPLRRAEPAKDLPLRDAKIPQPPVEITPKEPATPKVARRLEEEFHIRPRDRLLATVDILPPSDSRVPKGEAIVFSPEPEEGEPAEIEIVYRWKPVPPPPLFDWDGQFAIDTFLGKDFIDDDIAAYALGEFGRLVVKGNLEIAPRGGWMRLGSESGPVVGVGARMTW